MTGGISTQHAACRWGGAAWGLRNQMHCITSFYSIERIWHKVIFPLQIQSFEGVQTRGSGDQNTLARRGNSCRRFAASFVDNRLAVIPTDLSSGA